MEDNSKISGMMFRCRSDSALSFTFADDGAEAVTGYTPAELVDTGLIFLPDLIHPDDRDMVRSSIQAGISEERSYTISCRLLDKEKKQSDGIIIGTGIFRSALTLTGLEGYIIKIPTPSFKLENKIPPDNISSDFVEGDKKLTQIELLKYFQIISDIIRKKQVSNTGPGHDMRYCIILHNIISLISDQYNIDSGLHTEKFLLELSELIMETYSQENYGITLSISNVEQEQLTGYQGLCIGIITCEQCCNVFEYAFNPGQTGGIEVSFRQEEGWLIFQISDNGKGFPSSIIQEKNSRGGLGIVEQISKDLLGTMNLLNDNGAVLRVIFPVDVVT